MAAATGQTATLQGIYRITGFQHASQGYDVLGVWGAVPYLPAGVAFTTPGEQSNPITRWQADYPSNLRQAEAHLSLGTKLVDISRSALSEVETRLERLVQSYAAQTGGLSFGALAQAISPQLQAEC
ncbi:MAG TPA: hypothetical protein VFG99_04365, partial [Chloroflexia bacterium]|nr:hypothetical protein [Chloroflexia bacterium]